MVGVFATGSGFAADGLASLTAAGAVVGFELASGGVCFSAAEVTTLTVTCSGTVAATVTAAAAAVLLLVSAISYTDRPSYCKLSQKYTNGSALTTNP